MTRGEFMIGAGNGSAIPGRGHSPAHASTTLSKAGVLVKLIDISTPKFPDTFTMVDDADYDFLNQWKWCLQCANGYVTRSKRIDGKCHSFRMHVEILKPPKGMICDHRFGNKLDNRRENLRICTYSENNRNRSPHKGRTLPKGVCWHARDRRFMVRIKVNRRDIHLGYFRTESEADAAYKAAAIKYHGEFARLK